MLNPRIEFEKWHDAIAAEIANQESEEEEDSFDVNTFEKRKVRSEVGPCIVGPYGIVPINESNLPSKNFNFWIVHTNFRLEYWMEHLIQHVNGIETYEPLTPYRWRIAIGRLFDEDKVKLSLSDQLITNIKARSQVYIDKTIEYVKMSLGSWPFWAIIVTESGIKVFKGETKEEVVAKFENLEYDKLITSWQS